MKRLSPAKVNLYLRVLRRRKDGYHDLATLMQQISLYDELTFLPRDKGVILHCQGGGVPEDETNNVYRAAEAVLTHTGCTAGVDITLDKHIPIAAGLGGGSSNAAVTIMALNDLFALRLSRAEMIGIGASLGADVPFFIFGPCAWAFGIGDHLEAVPDGLPTLWFVLLNPPLHIPTKMVYERLNLGLTNESIHYSIRRFCTATDVAHGLRNDLERVTFAIYPYLKQFKDALLQRGALGTLMSGSGPTVFGIFADQKNAAHAAAALEGAGSWSVYTACSL
jgi:4-diphosphocytidyl-2-C-methyl-D-erythritol kinase